MFMEIANDEREAIIARNGFFRTYRAFFGWQRINHEWKADERPYMPGHRLDNGNWIIPSCCRIIEE